MSFLKNIRRTIYEAVNSRYWLVRTLRSTDNLVLERRFRAVPDPVTGYWQVYLRADSRKILEKRPNGEIVCGNLVPGLTEKGPMLSEEAFIAYFQKMSDGGFVQKEWKWPKALRIDA